MITSKYTDVYSVHSEGHVVHSFLRAITGCPTSLPRLKALKGIPSLSELLQMPQRTEPGPVPPFGITGAPWRTDPVGSGWFTWKKASPLANPRREPTNSKKAIYES